MYSWWLHLTGSAAHFHVIAALSQMVSPLSFVVNLLSSPQGRNYLHPSSGRGNNLNCEQQQLLCCGFVCFEVSTSNILSYVVLTFSLPIYVLF